MKRPSYQFGTLYTEPRKSGPDVWVILPGYATHPFGLIAERYFGEGQVKIERVRLLSAKNNHVVDKSFHGCVKWCQEEM
jgi:hypothetical protein